MQRIEGFVLLLAVVMLIWLVIGLYVLQPAVETCVELHIRDIGGRCGVSGYKEGEGEGWFQGTALYPVAGTKACVRLNK